MKSLSPALCLSSAPVLTTTSAADPPPHQACTRPSLCCSLWPRVKFNFKVRFCFWLRCASFLSLCPNPAQILWASTRTAALDHDDDDDDGGSLCCCYSCCCCCCCLSEAALVADLRTNKSLNLLEGEKKGNCNTWGRGGGCTALRWAWRGIFNFVAALARRASLWKSSPPASTGNPLTPNPAPTSTPTPSRTATATLGQAPAAEADLDCICQMPTTTYRLAHASLSRVTI